MIGVGLVGFGYWGPNLARNFSTAPECRLLAICDAREDRLAIVRQYYPGCLATPRFEDLLDNKEIHAIAIATPVASHFALAQTALLAGKDLLIEKPFTRTSSDAERLVALAERDGRILAVDHTFLYTDAVRKIKDLVESGAIGELLYIDSVRTNLGLFQPDHNVLWDLAPHEFSIVDFLVQRDPVSIQVQGACHTENAIENLAYVHMEYEGNLIAHFHLNWLAPVKIRQTIIAGSRKMIVYDDMEQHDKLKIYDKGIALRPVDGPDAHFKTFINYRTGDMVVPPLKNHEALSVEIAHFIDSIKKRTQPLADGHAGLKVVRLLEAAQESLKHKGARVMLRRSSEAVLSFPDQRQVA